MSTGGIGIQDQNAGTDQQFAMVVDTKDLTSKDLRGAVSFMAFQPLLARGINEWMETSIRGASENPDIYLRDKLTFALGNALVI